MKINELPYPDANPGGVMELRKELILHIVNFQPESCEEWDNILFMMRDIISGLERQNIIERKNERNSKVPKLPK